MNSYQRLILGLLTLSLAVLAYWDGLIEAVLRWNTQEEYSHGFLIPLVSLYIIWEKKDYIKASITAPNWWGIAIVLVASIVYIIGELSALYILIQYAFILTLFGISLVFLGKGSRQTLIPILLLLFAIPLPYVIEVILTAKLQLWSSWLGVQFIRLFQIPVFLEGNIIDLGIYQLQVVEACSGLRYLFPLMSLGFIAAYFYQATFWKRALVFISTVPITIFMNSFRIGMIGVLVNHFGISQAEGFLHDFEGWIIFMACSVLLVLLILLIERMTTKQSFAKVFGMPEIKDSKLLSVSSSSVKIYGVTAILLLILSAAFFITKHIDNRIEFIPEHKAFVNFPVRLDEWNGTHELMEKAVQEKLKMTDYLYVNYYNDKREFVNFYVAYYESQRKGESPHSPRVCIPGGGWEIAEFKRTKVNNHPVNRVLIKKGSHRQLVYYWFEGHGRIVANEYINKWYLLQDSIFKNRTDGSLVRVVTPVDSSESLIDADERLAKFLSVAEPELKQFISN